MDQNASANVQATQPDPTSAPQSDVANGTNPTPAAAGVAKGATPTTDPGAGVAKPSFDPEIQKFLDNQNIKTDDPIAAISELAKRNMELRSNKPTQSVADVLNQKPEAKAPEPEKPATPAPEPQQTSHTLSDMEIANVSLFVMFAVFLAFALEVVPLEL